MRFLLSLLLLMSCAFAQAQDVQPVPPINGRVMDLTHTLSAAQVQALDSKLAAFEAQAGPQIVVLMVPTVAPEDIVDYTQRVGDQWKLGRRDVGDGLLIVVAKDDRKIRIAPAKALEGAVPDLAARQIIDGAIKPAFKKDDFAGGLNLAIDQLEARIRGESLPAPAARHINPGTHSSGIDFSTLAIMFFIGVPVLGAVLTAMLGRVLGSVVTSGGAGAMGWMLGGSVFFGVLASVVSLVLIGVMGAGAMRSRSGLRSSYGGGGGFVPPVIWGGGGGGSGSGIDLGGGGGGGGGFSSGGGGDFGGGGASGGW
ncbi:MAG TPA: TPM domain-containing protein [Burkholderiaceae bacterium]